MKLLSLFLLIGCMQLHAKTSAQTVSLSERNADLVTVFNKIERQTGYTFFYETKLLAQAKKVDINSAGEALDKVLQRLFSNQPFQYQIVEKNIVVTEKLATKPIVDIDIPMAPPLDVKGVVRDESGKPAAGVSVMIKGTGKGTSTNERGEFALSAVPENATLVFSSINLQTFEVRVTAEKAADLAITLKTKISELADVTIRSVSTGYQQIPKERATGSFEFIDSALLNRRISTNILDRIDGVASGVVFNKNIVTNVGGINNSDITIRGRNTILANPNPLIIVDNFPYDGDLSTINPNDIENITILKDAAAASIWGAFSGNGVIVITTKKGKFNQPLQVTATMNFTIGERPNLFYTPRISSANYVEIEEFLWGKGFYNALLNLSSRPVMSPVVEILAKRDAGSISAADAAAQINAYRNHDLRDDLSKYYYRQSVNQQYAINLQGGGIRNKFFFSVGFDNNKSNAVNNDYSRITINANNTYSFLKNRLEFYTGISYIQSNTVANNPGISFTPYPYMPFADANGKSLSVVNQLRQAYLDTAGQGKLLDWNYRPLDELNLQDNVTKLTEIHLNTSLKYKVLKGLDISLLYVYNRSVSDNENYRSQQTYFTRDQINRFTQINFASNQVTYNLPLGGILDSRNSNLFSHIGRAQASYNEAWKNDHEISAIAGLEVRTINNTTTSGRLYGYDKEYGTTGLVNYTTLFPNYQNPNVTLRITPNISNSGNYNNYISYFGNAGYSIKKRYNFSASIRRDESNIFGVNINQKGIPLWSIGFAWNLSKESFYHLSWLPYARVRITNGYSGNLYNSASAFLTTIYNSTPNTYGAVVGSIRTPPNPDLRWERNAMLNVGIDFAVKNNIISGSIEYFRKKGTDIIGASPLAPQTGQTTFTGNTANMEGQGMDVSLTSRNIDRIFKWSTFLLFNWHTDKITEYKVKQTTMTSYLNEYMISPLVGRPVYAVHAFRSAGLDANGNTQVYLDGKVSTNYTGLNQSTNFDNLRYMGPANPVIFGSLRNQFNYKDFELSFNITYKFGYYFRRNSISYNSLFSNTVNTTNIYFPDEDYVNRWQKPGDENRTYVPSFVYPVMGARDGIYRVTDDLVEKGDHIRLQDIQLNYNVSRKIIGKHIQSLRFFVYINNLGILWRANKFGLDPDYLPNTYAGGFVFPDPKTYGMGFRIGF